MDETSSAIFVISILIIVVVATLATARDVPESSTTAQIGVSSEPATDQEEPSRQGEGLGPLYGKGSESI